MPGQMALRFGGGLRMFTGRGGAEKASSRASTKHWCVSMSGRSFGSSPNGFSSSTAIIFRFQYPKIATKQRSGGTISPRVICTTMIGQMTQKSESNAARIWANGNGNGTNVTLKA